MKQIEPFYEVENPWRCVDSWRDKLRDCTTHPRLEALEGAWQRLAPHDGNALKRDQLEKISDHPVATLFALIDEGIYPPPELLLALLDAWNNYIAFTGEVSLDYALFGPPKKKAGNYARQRAASVRKGILGAEFAALQQRGFTRAKASEELAAKHPGPFEPETIARTTPALIPKRRRKE